MYRPALLSIIALAGCTLYRPEARPGRRAVPAPAPGSAPATGSVDPLASLVGVEHPPRRTGVAERGSYLIDESGRGRWVVAEIATKAPAMRAVSLDEIVSGGSTATARWRTVAVQRVDAVDSLLPVHLGTCEVAGRHDRLVVGVGKPSATVAVRQAWRVDTLARRFVGLDASTVRCLDLTNT